MSLLETRGLTKYFGGLAAVVDVDLNVEAGEIVGLIGPNGAGKTTIFNLLTGLHRPTSGGVIFKGRDVTGFKPHRVAGYGLSRTWQITTLFKGMSTLDSVVLAHHLHRKSSLFDCVFKLPSARGDERVIRERAAEILDFLGLTSYKDELPFSLPYGFQRILGVAMTMATDPELMLMDEPVTGMNPTEAVAMMDTIQKIRERGITILVVEHNMKVVMGTCERIYVLDFGRKIAEGKPEEVSKNKDVIEAYLGAEVE